MTRRQKRPDTLPGIKAKMYLSVLYTVLNKAKPDHNIVCTQVYLNIGYPVNNTYNGHTPLYYAALMRDLDMMKMLITHGANVNTEFLLHYAVSCNYTEMTVLLLQSGTDVNLRDFYLMSAIDYALEYADTSIVKMLLRYGASLPDNAYDIALRSNIDRTSKISLITRYT